MGFPRWACEQAQPTPEPRPRFRSELQAARVAEVKARAIGDDDSADTTPQREVGGPESLLL